MRHLALVFVFLTAACGNGSGPDEGAAEPDASADAGAERASNGLCVHMGPQTPRDIGSATGLNTEAFPLAPPASEMNLCNIHTHTNAEHKG
ncbi:MAG: cadmium carbonic anhydrase, partial [Gammaproteobacteria bacterium]|nr:cadmium carbonic anhydrase [Gammaproteobacteria bacterium]